MNRPLILLASAAALGLLGCHSLRGFPGAEAPAAATAPATPSTRPDAIPGAILAGYFANPIVASMSAGDPCVVFHDGYYYMTASVPMQDGMYVWKSRTLDGMDSAQRVKIWSAPKSGPQSRLLWAPEIHLIRGRWYVYFTASDGPDAHHRHYVLESAGPDALGPYEDRGRVDPEFEHYAIDGSVLKLADASHHADGSRQADGSRRADGSLNADVSLYWMYVADFPERGLWMAPMESPTRVRPGAKRLRFCVGTEDWEAAWVERGRDQWVKADFYWVEGPHELHHNGRTFVSYSAGHTATPHYYLGLLELTGDPMLQASWKKLPGPAFAPANGVFTTGHNGFTTSPDGTENWLVYHARDAEWDRSVHRTIRAQPFTWNPDGTPDLGAPIPAGKPLKKPSGE